MSDYRAYILGKDGHRFMKVVEFLDDHPDDAAAMKAAKQLDNEHEVELWECSRLVALFAPPRRTKTTLRNFTVEYILRMVEFDGKEQVWGARPRIGGMGSIPITEVAKLAPSAVVFSV
ncbi:hypothetical protein [Bradyrhizobium erythrophlei]|jgi:hypothetical protein|uniref:Uncharacterized protein n=1 Tax=Bradyrhizobium erythrophlei TaxID=1437360 RepID=A0A1M5GCE4_9BRAD|nr:hypothetical protein [Bradyrhizobium erythrophlei]SHG01417.1 hypothetical protein SAMN05444169_0056 [Bradyrhizobium erythrophlei]